MRGAKEKSKKKILGKDGSISKVKPIIGVLIKFGHHCHHICSSLLKRPLLDTSKPEKKKKKKTTQIKGKKKKILKISKINYPSLTW